MSSSTGLTFKRLVIAGMAVSTVALTAACSKNGGGGGEQPKPQATPVPAAPPVQPHVNGGGSELDGNSGRSAQTGGDTSVTSPENVDSTIDKKVTYFDPTGLTPEQIFSKSSNDDSGSVGVESDVRDFSGRSLVYSGSGQDNLREQLWALANSVQDPDQRAADASLAREIGLTTYTVDWNTRTMKISLLQVKNGQRRQINMEGVLDNRLMARFGSLETSNFAAEAMCMDLNGGCYTIHIKFMEYEHGRPRNAHILARNTRASLYVEGNGYGLSHNPEYDRLLGIMWNSAQRPGSNESLKRLTIDTSETINGSSNYMVTMKIKTASPLHPQGGEQFLVWTGPLVKPSSSDRLNVPAELAPSYNTVGGQPVALEGLVSDTIRDTRLVRNDGHGNLQLAVTVRKSTATAKEDTLLVTISRMHKPTRELVLR